MYYALQAHAARAAADTVQHELVQLMDVALETAQSTLNDELRRCNEELTRLEVHLLPEALQRTLAGRETLIGAMIADRARKGQSPPTPRQRRKSVLEEQVGRQVASRKSH